MTQLCQVLTDTKTGAELCSVDGFVCRGLTKGLPPLCVSEVDANPASYSSSDTKTVRGDWSSAPNNSIFFYL